MDEGAAGFRELEHTADWELHVWAPDLPALLEYAARGMYSLSGTRLQPEPRLQRCLKFSAPDAETLLVSFLSELLYLGESEGLGFDRFTFDLQDAQLQASVEGAPIADQSKEIKAVTYHKLAILRTQRGLEVKIVFDV